MQPRNQPHNQAPQTSDAAQPATTDAQPATRTHIRELRELRELQRVPRLQLLPLEERREVELL